jgi:phosphate:Na+ symporter
LGLLFIGLGLMSDAMRPLRSFQPFIDLMATMAHPLAGVAAGAAFTALVQSSSATNGVVIALATGGLVTLEAGVALALGANLGTCVTAWLAGVGRPAAARRVAAAHVAFNVVGVALWIGFLPELAALARAVSPEAPGFDGFARLAAETPRQIANANTLFNVANTLALIGFSGVLARVLERLIPEPPAPPPELALDRALLDTPAAALAVARRALRDMGARIETVIAALGAARLAGDAEAFRRLRALDDRLDRAQAELADYLASLRREAMGAADVATAQTVLTAATELEAVGDLLAERVPEIALRWRREDAAAPGVAAAAALDAVYDKVALAARLAAEAVAENDAILAGDAVAAADAADVEADGLSTLHAARLADGPQGLATLRLEAEIASALRHAASHARRCALLALSRPMADDPTATAPIAGRAMESA